MKELIVLFGILVIVTCVAVSLWFGNNPTKIYPETYVRILYYDKICDCLIKEEIRSESLTIRDGYFIFNGRKVANKNVKEYCKF